MLLGIENAFILEAFILECFLRFRMMNYELVVKLTELQ